jgi:hypothetical protein
MDRNVQGMETAHAQADVRELEIKTSAMFCKGPIPRRKPRRALPLGSPRVGRTASSTFHCSICGGERVGRTEVRGDRFPVLFCARCGMGVIAKLPPHTAHFYGDDYYEQSGERPAGYIDYEFTAEHSLLWVVVLLEMLFPKGGSISAARQGPCCADLASHGASRGSRSISEPPPRRTRPA